MDDDAQDREPRTSEPGAEVGLGRVVENRGGLGRDEPREGDEARQGDEPLVEEASEESFPASDPPGYGSRPATPSDGGGSPREPGRGEAPGRERPGTGRGPTA